MQALLGIIVLLALSWLMSENRRAISWRLSSLYRGAGHLGGVFLHAPWLSSVLLAINGFVSAVGEATTAGTVCLAFWAAVISRSIRLLNHPTFLPSSAASSRRFFGCGRLALALAGPTDARAGVELGVTQNVSCQRHCGDRSCSQPISRHD